MKIKHISLLTTVIILAGCTCFPVRGKKFSECQYNVELPNARFTNQTTLENGNKLYTYKKVCNDEINWEKKTVEVSPDDIIINTTYLACPIYTDIQGESFDDYVQKYGVPVNEYTLKNGNKLYSYKNLCPDKKNWLEYNIEVGQQNKIVQRKDIKVCPV